MKDFIIEKIYKTIKKPYQMLFKKETKAWDLSIKDFLEKPENSLGFHLGCFLLKHSFAIQPQLEEHDVYHVLTNTGITVKDEIAMQFYLFGNGKKSPFLFIVILTGILFYPFQINHFIKSYKKGKNAHQFYNLEFYKMLHIPLTELQFTFNIK